MPRHLKNAFSGTSVRRLVAVPKGNPLNPYDHLSSDERRAKLVSLLGRVFRRILRSQADTGARKVS
jgi:hypothetical protein